jgi:hypothetical protein
MGLVRFMDTMAGRTVRIAAGLALIIGGLLAGGTAGWAVAVVGVVPLAAGLVNVCLLRPAVPRPLPRWRPPAMKHRHGGGV